jgi:hypothetical protein
MAHSYGFLHHFDRTFEVESLSRTQVQLQRNGIQVLLTVRRQVRALG